MLRLAARPEWSSFFISRDTMHCVYIYKKKRERRAEIAAQKKKISLCNRLFIKTKKIIFSNILKHFFL